MNGHGPTEIETETVDFLVVGAGAAGLSAAKCLALHATVRNQSVVVLEAHTEPGGQAGYFARGSPRRLFDAGATQLIDCGPDGLQTRLLEMGGAARARARRSQSGEPATPHFDRIESLTHHFEDGSRIELQAEGGLRYFGLHGTEDFLTLDATGAVLQARGAVPPVVLDDLRMLVRLLESCTREALWMWDVFHALPRFPLQDARDLLRALQLASVTPFSRLAVFPLLLASSFQTACRALGMRDDHRLTREVMEGLLLDTTQNSSAASPYLAGLMGVSVLRRGIFRARGGMRSVFRPLMSDARNEGATIRTGCRVTALVPSREGWRVYARLAPEGNRAESARTVCYVVRRGLVCNLTIWTLVEMLSSHESVRATRVFRMWQEAATGDDAWGAFAVYATIRDEPRMPDGPWFHQVFPRMQDKETLACKANYVSVSGRDDPAAPAGMRVVTTTMHVPARELTPSERSFLKSALVVRTQSALQVTFETVETATPSTYARFTGRSKGRVGGLPMTSARFLFGAPPALLQVPGVPAALAVAGDTVFPGQGIIACLASGIAAFERVARTSFTALENECAKKGLSESTVALGTPPPA